MSTEADGPASDEADAPQELAVHPEEMPSDTVGQLFSPGRIVAYLIAVIFVAEVIVMGLLDVFAPDLPPVSEALVDSTALVLLIFPALYVGLFRPMYRSINQLQAQKKAMKRFKRTIDYTEEQRNNLEVLNEVLRHDMRNDLQLVSAYTDLLADHVENEEATEHLESISECTNNAISLTETARVLADIMLHPDTENEPILLDAVISEELNDVRDVNPQAEI